jgi:hypothetical protein
MDANGVALHATGKVLRVARWRVVFGAQHDDEEEPESNVPTMPDGIDASVQAMTIDARKTTIADAQSSMRCPRKFLIQR